MPTYTYACTDCDEQLEVVQSFTAEPLTDCPRCHGRLRKVFHPVGVVFKGSGFYRTDSRDSKKAPGSSGAGGSRGDKAGASEKPGSGSVATGKSGSGSSGSGGSSSGSSSPGGSSSSSPASSGTSTTSA